MARDIEADVVIHDKSERGLASAARNVDKFGKKIKSDLDEMDRGVTKGLLRAVESVAPKFAASMASMFEGAASAGGPLLMGGIAASVLVAAPLLGATISGAIIGGAGLGGVIGGLAIAARDVRVQQAATTLGQKLLSRLELAGGAFVQPALDGIQKIDKALDSINIERIFKNSAKFVGPLTDGVTSAIRDLGSAIDELIANAGPSIDAIADGIASIGKAVGDGLKSLADNGDDAASALRVVFFVISESISEVFATVNALTELYGIINKLGGVGVLGVLAGDMDKVGESGRRVGEGTFGAAQGIQKVADTSSTAAGEVSSLAEHLHELTDAGREIFDSFTTVGEAIDKVTEAAKKNSKTISIDSAVGRENREVLSGLAKALQRHYDAVVAVAGAGESANEIATESRATFIRLATTMTGSAAKARVLADQILGIPKAHETRIHADPEPAVTAARRAQGAIDAVHGKTVTINVRVNAGALNKIRLGKLGPQAGANYSAADFAETITAADHRVGGPTPVNLKNDVSVYLDGAPFYEYTATAVRKDSKRQAYVSRRGRW